MAANAQRVTIKTLKNNLRFSSCSVKYFKDYVYKLDRLVVVVTSSTRSFIC